MPSQLDFACPVPGPVRWAAVKAPSRIIGLAREACTVSLPLLAFVLATWAARHRERRDHKREPSRVKDLSLRTLNDMCKVELRGCPKRVERAQYDGRRAGCGRGESRPRRLRPGTVNLGRGLAGGAMAGRCPE